MHPQNTHESSDIAIQHKGTSFRMKSAGLVISISLCIIAIAGIVIRSPDQANSLAVFALACIAMILGLAQVVTLLAEKRIQEITKTLEKTDALSAEVRKLADLCVPALKDKI